MGTYILTVWRCKVCDTVFTSEGKEPPKECPKCGPRVDKTQFELIHEGEKFFAF